MPGGWLVVSGDEAILRGLLWAACPCPGKYGDDGELQCACPERIDYRRDTANEIASKIRARGSRLLAESKPVAVP